MTSHIILNKLRFLVSLEQKSRNKYKIAHQQNIMPAPEENCQCVCFTVLRAWLKFKREMKKIPVCILGLCGVLAAFMTPLFACLLYAMCVRCNFVSDKVCSTCGKANWEIAGTFGDSFGAINAFFAGLNVVVAAAAFGGFIHSLKLQREDLRLQRKEMQDSRLEMQNQTSELKSQTKVQENQLADERRNYEEERVHRLRRAELDEAYRLIELVHHRVQDFSFPDTFFRMQGVMPALRDWCNLPKADEIRTDGAYGFHILAERIIEYARFLNNYLSDKKGFEAATDEFYRCLNMAGSVSCVFGRAMCYIVRDTPTINDAERKGLLRLLCSSYVGDIKLAFLVSLEGSPMYPVENDFAFNYSESVLEDERFAIYSENVKDAFMQVARYRFDMPNNRAMRSEIEQILQQK